MDEKKYRTYTEEFKTEALALLASSEKSAGQMGRVHVLVEVMQRAVILILNKTQIV